MRKRLEGFGEVGIVDETNGFELDFVERQRVDLGAPPQMWEQCSKEERVWDLYIVSR